MTKVALTGASGRMGSMLRGELLDRGLTLRSASGARVLAPLCAQEDTLGGDLRDPAFVDRLLEGIDVLLHFAGTSGERPLAEIIDNNLIALHQVYEGSVRHGVRRVVLASTNHAFGMYPVDQRLQLDCAYRPDGLYGLSKVWGEAMARMYWDKHGIEGICLRIGTCSGKPPTQPRHLATWLGRDDLVQLVMRCIGVESVGFLCVWAVSNNTRSYWSNAGAERLGYVPQQNAERYAAEVEQSPDPRSELGRRHQGGNLAALNFTAHVQSVAESEDHD